MIVTGDNSEVHIVGQPLLLFEVETDEFVGSVEVERILVFGQVRGPEPLLHLLSDFRQDPIQRMFVQLPQLCVEGIDIECALSDTSVRQGARQGGVTHEEIWMPGYKVRLALGNIRLCLVNEVGEVIFLLSSIVLISALGHTTYSENTNTDTGRQRVRHHVTDTAWQGLLVHVTNTAGQGYCFTLLTQQGRAISTSRY